MSRIEWVFQDEQGTNLNRYKATNVSSGEEYIFDLLRNGSISVVGTPLNATTLNSLVNAINDNYERIISLVDNNTTYSIQQNGNEITLVGSDSSQVSVNITKSDLGLGNVDNTSDVNKPISNATREELNKKVDKTTTINGKALSSNVSLSKGDIGLSNVDNTSDNTKKTNFTGSIANGNNGFVTGNDVYNYVENNKPTKKYLHNINIYLYDYSTYAPAEYNECIFSFSFINGEKNSYTKDNLPLLVKDIFNMGFKNQNTLLSANGMVNLAWGDKTTNARQILGIYSVGSSSSTYITGIKVVYINTDDTSFGKTTLKFIGEYIEVDYINDVVQEL